MSEVRAKKKFGQNFLQDKNIINNIIEEANIDSNTLVIEIGPGTGALTRHLVLKAGYLIAYEIDTDLVPLLEEEFKDKQFKVVNQDILTVNLEEEISKYKDKYSNVVIVGNLPYYITTPIILGLLEKNLDVKAYVFMVQLEVAERLTAIKGGKEYNALSVLINYKTKASKCFNVSPNAFKPVPGVWSAVIKMVPREYHIKPKNEKFFLELNRAIFKQRRKTLANNLQNFNIKKDKINEALKKLDLKPTCRSEELSVEEIIKLSDILGE